MKKCPFCAEEIQDAAMVCRFCQADLKTGTAPPTRQTFAQTVVVQPTPSTPSPGIAAILSLVIPGAGQMYAGNIVSGIVWLLVVVIGYAMFIIPGLILHPICILMAASAASNRASAARAIHAVPVSQPTTAPASDGQYPSKSPSAASAPAPSPEEWYPSKATGSVPAGAAEKEELVS